MCGNVELFAHEGSAILINFGLYTPQHLEQKSAAVACCRA